MVLHTYVLRVQYSCGVVLVFWFWREIVFGVTYVLSVQLHCVGVSVFWLWREILLKMRTFLQKILLGYFFYFCISLSCIVNCVKNANTQNENTFIQNNLNGLLFLLLHISFLYCQSCQKCEHWQSHFDYLNNAYWVSLFKRNNSLAKICFS